MDEHRNGTKGAHMEGFERAGLHRSVDEVDAKLLEANSETLDRGRLVSANAQG